MARGPVFLILFALLVNTTLSSQVVAQQTSSDKDLKRVQEIKKVVFRARTVADNQVEVRLKDKTQLVGSISEVTDDHFVVKTGLNGVSSTLTYDQVDRVKIKKVSTGRDFSTTDGILRKVAFVTALGVGALLVGCLVSRGCVQ
jgi:hypothetical protein